MWPSEANAWFCENQGNHTVFERQRKYWLQPQYLLVKDIHKTKCKKWPKQYEKLRTIAEKKRTEMEKKLRDEESKRRK